MKKDYDQKTIVEFGFVMKNYYRDNLNIEGTNFYVHPVKFGEHEVRGRKTLKLFKSWFRLAKNSGRLLYGFVKFIDSGEAWLWQNPKKVYRGGWHRAIGGKGRPKQLSLQFET